MMTKNNEFAKLLLYLEKEGICSTSQKRKEKPKKEKVSYNTKKLLEESQVKSFSEIPHIDYSNKSSTKGFDLDRFESLMRSKLIDDHKRMQSYERPYISVSELYTCLRKCYYSRKRYNIEIKKQFSFSYLYLIQKVGNVIHELIQNLYDFTEVEKSILSEKYKVKGRVDALKNNFLYEIKSIDIDKFKNKYLQEHYYQGIIYAYILNKEYNYNIKNITIIYVIRNLKRMYPFDLPTNNELAKEFLSRALILKEALNTNQVPEPIGSSDEQCKYCSYKKFCIKDKIQTTNIKKNPIKNERKETVFLL
jgi:CRISPR/Cas system-associated exonuclease Cas4 (RecB family)